MTARVLIVDDLAPNVKLLEAKLANEYYEYASAYSGREALEKVKEFRPDIILLDVMMPEMDGFEACRILKSDPATSYIPVVMVTALSEVEDRVTGLEAGADDFLTKPINDVHLFARVKSLVRVKMMLDELRMRDKTGAEFGVIEQTSADNNNIEGANVMVVNDDVVESRQISETLANVGVNVRICSLPEAVSVATTNDFDLIIVSTQIDEGDGLRLCMQLRSQEITRNVPTLILVDGEDKNILIKGLEMGINDYIVTPLEPNELIARARAQIKRNHYQDALRSNYEQSLSMAIMDGLTKLYNRNYLDAHLKNIVEEAVLKGSPLSIISLDIDHFKEVNDKPGWGHHVGDEVLQQVAQRILGNVRTTDLATRPGGEEFTVVMPATDIRLAEHIGERIRASMEAHPFKISAEPGEARVTVSIGVVSLSSEINTPESMLHKADEALYKAKNSGRNKVVVYGMGESDQTTPPPAPAAPPAPTAEKPPEPAPHPEPQPTPAPNPNPKPAPTTPSEPKPEPMPTPEPMPVPEPKEEQTRTTEPTPVPAPAPEPPHTPVPTPEIPKSPQEAPESDMDSFPLRKDADN